MALAFAAVALWLGRGQLAIAASLAGLALLWLAVGLLRPTALAGLRRRWMTLAGLLHRISSPLVLGLLFFAVLSPVALIQRLFGRDVLRLRRDSGADSYWIPRDPPGPEVQGLRDPF